MAEPSVRRSTAGDVQHLLRQVQAERALGQGAQQAEHAAGAGAQIDQPVERPRTGGGQDRGLDIGFRDIEGAQLIPAGGVLGEIVCRGLGALGAHRVQAGRVAGQAGVAPIGQGEHLVDEGAGGAVGGEAIKDPGAVGKPLDKAGGDQELEVARHARLALVQDAGQLGHRQLLARQQRQDAKPRWLAGGPQHLHNLTRGEAHEWI
jgi:hypothetical protein